MAVVMVPGGGTMWWWPGCTEVAYGVVVMMPLRGTVAEAVGRSGMALMGVTVP